MSGKIAKEDPTRLSAIQWIKRALSLNIIEIFRRTYGLLLSLTKNCFKIALLVHNSHKAGQNLKLIIMTERLGDIIAAHLTVSALKTDRQNIVWIVRKRFSDILQFNPYLNDILDVSSYTETIFLRYLFPKLDWKNLHIDRNLCNIFGLQIKNKNIIGINIRNYYNFGSLSEIYSLIGLGVRLKGPLKIYPDQKFNVESYLSKIFSNPQLPVIFLHVVSDEAARSWSTEQCLCMSNWIIDNTILNIVELGLTPIHQKSDRIYPLRAELNLAQQAKLLSSGKVFVGVDSGFAHMANALQVRSILLIGAFNKFQDHTPWQLNEHDLVIRSDEQAHNIRAEEIIEHLKEIFNPSKILKTDKKL